VNEIIALQPIAPSCGATCSANFASSTPVALAATRASGFIFTGWGGACTRQMCRLTSRSPQRYEVVFFVASYGNDSNPCTFVSPCKNATVTVFVFASYLATPQRPESGSIPEYL
jgi:hypothetical protein